MTAMDETTTNERRGEPISVVYTIPSEQRLSYRVRPNDGGFLTAAAVGGQIEAIADLLERIAKKDNPDQKWQVAITAAYTEADGSLNFELLLAPHKQQ
jgi:hypothetical protein